ncbi:hypothetical protein FGO68_gene6112 [Halteria grandinella]|uniref:Uncharacterized protein n=1 Tax=Halteria grandinella TaxID=5974 RepID=A0A8J8NUH4_HALGN|nr:hypothetical protein FGO68_gene6112 [Halteria grandinella]
MQGEPLRVSNPIELTVEERLSLTIENFMHQQTESDYTHSEVRRETEEAVVDCALDDPEMLTTKSHLIKKVTPLSLINVLQAKHPKLNITERLMEIPQRAGSGSVKINPKFSCVIETLGSSQTLKAESVEANKKQARHVAAQRFLKMLFPQAHIYTWNKVSQLVTTMKEPLAHLLSPQGGAGVKQ